MAEDLARASHEWVSTFLFFQSRRFAYDSQPGVRRAFAEYQPFSGQGLSHLAVQLGEGIASIGRTLQKGQSVL